MIEGSKRSQGDVIAEMKMSATSFHGAFLLVEGASDSKFFKHHADPSGCEIVICGAKRTVLESIRGVQPLKGIRALGVVDDDFDRVLGVSHLGSDVVSTDTPDLETLLLASEALDKFVAEHADPLKLAQIEATERRPFRECLVARSKPFGKLRLINTIENYGVSFCEHLSPWKYFDVSTWSLDENRLITDFSTLAGISNGDMVEYMNVLSKLPDWDLIQGHDAIAILAIGFRDALSDGKAMSDKAITSALRLAHSREMFMKTILRSEIISWQTHSSSSVLK